MLADKVRDLGFNGLSQQNTRPIAQDFGELVADVSWLNQFDDVIFGHGISLLQWRSGGVKHPHDMPPFRFLPSPTFGDSSVSSLMKCSRQAQRPLVSPEVLKASRGQRRDPEQQSPFFVPTMPCVTIGRVLETYILAGKVSLSQCRPRRPPRYRCRPSRGPQPPSNRLGHGPFLQVTKRQVRD